MIELYYEATPNGRKILIALEELGLPYEVHWVDLRRGDQFLPDYTIINPNSKIPAIVDTEGPGGEPISLFESGAILQYLSEKTGRLLPHDASQRWEAICWLTWQVANQGPAAGNTAHFVHYAPAAGIDDEYAKSRYLSESRRCAKVLDDRLEGREFLAGEFSVADIACFPWTRVLKGYGIAVQDYPNLAAWSNRISARPSARVRLERPATEAPNLKNLTDEEYRRLFGVSPDATAQSN